MDNFDFVRMLSLGGFFSFFWGGVVILSLFVPSRAIFSFSVFLIFAVPIHFFYKNDRLEIPKL